MPLIHSLLLTIRVSREPDRLIRILNPPSSEKEYDVTYVHKSFTTYRLYVVRFEEYSIWNSKVVCKLSHFVCKLYVSTLSTQIS